MEQTEKKITAVVNVYKRYYTLQQQLDAITNQTIKPTDIIIVNNNNDDLRKNKEMIQTKYSNTLIVDISDNMGVWPRFFMGLLGRGDYIAVFDDDSIPGNKWFENCLTEMEKQEGLYGTIGLIYKGNNYFNHHQPRPGWHARNPNTVKVDIVGHSWFFKKEWISTFMNEVPTDLRNPIWLKSGEDIHLSYTLQKYKNISTFVPPHPPNNLSYFGSHPDLARKYGTDKNALSLEGAANSRFETVYRYYKNKNFKLLCNK